MRATSGVAPATMPLRRWVSLRLAERGDPVDAADEQHALLLDRRVAEPVGAGLAGVFRPDAVELGGDLLSARLPFPHLPLDAALDLHPVIRVLRVHDQDGEPRVPADPR